MRKKYLITIPALAAMLTCTSCNDWLDVMPDNRAEIDSSEKVYKLLVSAYPEISHVYCSELYSDNTDDFGASNPYSDRLIEQIYSWAEVTETGNEAPQGVWEACYSAITNANQALVAINDLESKGTEGLEAAKGEALLCRAYNHFILAGLFCEGYDPDTAGEKLGIPYMEAPETELNPKYERGTLAHVYDMIDKDLQEGLPLVNDAVYSIPKYHFNQKAAYTFASRFYLFKGDWDKAIQYATTALGTSPTENLRDYATLASLPKDEDVVPVQYNSTNAKNNFLVQATYSELGVLYGPYYAYKRHNQGNLLMQTEVMNLAPWGGYQPSVSSYSYGNMYKLTPYVYVATNLDMTMLPRCPYLFEYTDPVQGVGFARTSTVPLTAEEALLNRAEAYIMKEDYANALADINLWTNNTLNPSRCEIVNLTEDSIREWADGLEYYTAEAPTPKKHLHPLVAEVEEGSVKEAFVHCILYMRRVEFLQCGMRWFDVKRYGIEIYRRTLGTALDVVSVDDVMTVDDPRRAMQLPSDVITAGMTPNPR